MADMMKMASAMMAFQRQAAELLAATKADLAARGLGFSQDDLDTITAAAVAQPAPTGWEGQASAEQVADAQEVGRRALEADYPEHGFAPTDPRIAPVEGITLPLFAIAAKAIGWSTDEQLMQRVTTRLGIDVEAWKRAGEVWRQRVTDDVVVGAFYGQLFSQA